MPKAYISSPGGVLIPQTRRVPMNRDEPGLFNAKQVVIEGRSPSIEKNFPFPKFVGKGTQGIGYHICDKIPLLLPLSPLIISSPFPSIIRF